MPAAAWDKTRVFGTWNTQGGAMHPGRYRVTVPVRVTSQPDDIIIPAGVYKDWTNLNIVPGAPSLDTMVPANDDPDISPMGYSPDDPESGWRVIIEVELTGSKAEPYVLNTPVNGVVNLRTIVLATTIPAPANVFIRGVPGGLAELDSDGDVVDAFGFKVTAGSGGGGGDYATSAALTAGLATKAPLAHNHDAQYQPLGDYQPAGSYATTSALTTGLAGKASTTHNHDTRYVRTVNNTGPDANGNVTVAAGTGGATDHGALTGLADDDHTQYALADGTRGAFQPVGDYATNTAVSQKADAADVTSQLAGKAPTVHTHTSAQITDATTTGRASLTAVDQAAGRAAIAAAPLASPTFTGTTTVAGLTATGTVTLPAGSVAQAAVTGLAASLGSRLNFRGAWAAATAYAVNDVVTATVNGTLTYFRTLQAHTSANPAPTGTSAFFEVMGGGGSSGTVTLANLPAGSTVTVLKAAGVWPARPTARTDIVVAWKGADPSPAIVASGTGGMIDNVDYRLVTP